MRRTTWRAIFSFCLGFTLVGLPTRYGPWVSMNAPWDHIMPWVDGAVVLFGCYAAWRWLAPKEDNRG